jgi:hypothetical protein
MKKGVSPNNPYRVAVAAGSTRQTRKGSSTGRADAKVGIPIILTHIGKSLWSMLSRDNAKRGHILH